MPRVSVITTVRNGRTYLAEAIDSTLAQTDPDWEMIIVDDGSTDDTWDVITSYDDPRIRGIRSEAVGRAPALNLAVDAARGDYLAILDADDLSAPDRHQRQADLLDRHPELAFVGCGKVPQIDGSGRLLTVIDQHCETHEEITARLRRGVCPTEHSTAMLRRNLVEKVGGYDPAVPMGIDQDLYVRLLEHGRARHLPDPVASKRIHEHQHYWGPRGVGQVARERFRYSRHVQRNTVRILGAPRISAVLVPVEYWAKAMLKPIVRRFTRSGSQWRRMRQPPGTS